VRFFLSGGAPLARRIGRFFWAAGLPLYEGYGLTETSPVISVNTPQDFKIGTVGKPLRNVEVRSAPDGEILTRGPHVMKGYHNKPEATREALDPEGWFHTGDIGELDAEGFLRITDRKKDLIVTAGGKKVAPQPIEARLKNSRWVSEAVLLGDRKPYVVALLAPDFAPLEAEAKARGWAFATRRELVGRAEVLSLYQREIEAVNQDLAPFEQIKKFVLLENEMTQDRGELTPTLKVRRRVVAEKYASLIEGLYAGPAVAAPAAGR
jgi:long-chain acyl-CoA synthetase